METKQIDNWSDPAFLHRLAHARRISGPSVRLQSSARRLDRIADTYAELLAALAEITIEADFGTDEGSQDLGERLLTIADLARAAIAAATQGDQGRARTYLGD